MLLQQQSAAENWAEFRITRADLDYLFSQFLDRESPFTRTDLARLIVEHRLKDTEDRLRKQLERGSIFQPRLDYDIGQELIFPALEYAVGKVIGQRPGENPEYGDFAVLDVEFESGKRHEFAASLKMPHALNVDVADVNRAILQADPSLSADAILEQHGEAIVEEIEARLVDEEDAVSFGDLWYLRSLLADVNIGHLNLAEAMLDINEGVPLTPGDFLADLDLGAEVPHVVREFSLNVALANDERFDDVGAAGQVLWFLRRQEPEEVQTPPRRLLYAPIDYDAAVLTDELRQIEQEIDDELSAFEPPPTPPAESRLTINYAHRRVGTLPLTSRIRTMFPTAYESPRIRVTLVDSLNDEEFAGWVVHDYRYVFGLSEFYSNHRVPIGGYVTIQATDKPDRLILTLKAYRPRTEYIRLAVPSNNRLTFNNFKRSIGAEYDELLIVGAEDVKGVDAVWKSVQDRKRGLVEVMKDLIPELSKLNPQNAVHAKTLYAAVNVVKRCPPGPIFAALVTRDEFEHVGGPYWRLRTGGSQS